LDLGDVCLNRNASAGIPFEILHGWRDSHADSGVPTALPRLPQGGFPICQDRSLCGAKQVSVLETAGSRCPDNSYDNKNICPILGQGGRKLGTIQKKGHIKSGCNYDESQ